MRKLLDPDSDLSGVLQEEATEEHPFYHHIPARELREVFIQRGWKWEDYTRFCVVRNPYDRLVSIYHFQQKHFVRMKRSGWRGWLRKCFSSQPSFREFVMAVDTERRMPMSLGRFINDEQGRPLVDQVLRFETLDEELPPFLEGLGVKMPGLGMPHLNSSQQRRDYRSYYDEATQQHVAALYQEEIERFAYEF